MRSRPLSLGLLLLLEGACSQIIGLSGYENTDEAAGAAGSAAGGTAKGGASTGGESTSGGTNSGGDSNAGGEAGAGGEPAGGAGASNGGGGSGGAGGEGGEAGTGASGGSPTGGTAGKGGSGGTATGGTGKGGTGGVIGTGGTAGKGGSNTGGTATGGTATGGTATGGVATGGKSTGGTSSGGTTGGTATGGTGTGGATCSVRELLLNQNQNFDDSAGDPTAMPPTAPSPAPWSEFASDNSGTIQSQSVLAGMLITPQSPANAVWLGGAGSSFAFDDGGQGELYSLELDVTIPAGTTQVTFSCYYQTQTAETSATISASRDIMVAWFWDYGLKEAAYEFQRWGPSNTSTGWRLFSNTASGATAAALIGRALTLGFYAEVDDARRTDFFIDTCSLTVTVCN